MVIYTHTHTHTHKTSTGAIHRPILHFGGIFLNAILGHTSLLLTLLSMKAGPGEKLKAYWIKFRGGPSCLLFLIKIVRIYTKPPTLYLIHVAYLILKNIV